MLLRSLGKGLQTALPCRWDDEEGEEEGLWLCCDDHEGNGVDIHVDFNVELEFDLENHDDTDKLVPSVRPCLPTDPPGQGCGGDAPHTTVRQIQGYANTSENETNCHFSLHF